jgi:hypothetical protein
MLSKLATPSNLLSFSLLGVSVSTDRGKGLKRYDVTAWKYRRTTLFCVPNSLEVLKCSPSVSFSCLLLLCLFTELPPSKEVFRAEGFPAVKMALLSYTLAS